MPECDGYFDARGIQFRDEYADDAIYAVRSDPDLVLMEKKLLILCWFDVTYGQWQGLRYNLKNSRAKMAAWLHRSDFPTFEALLEAN